MKTQEISIIRIFAIWCAVLMTGCASTPAPTTQRVDVPIPVPCIMVDEVPVKPVYKFDKLPATASDGEKVIALAVDWPVGRKYEGQLEGIIAGCRSY